jgi:4-hydroxy-tetrahydrodipicolinate synthase
MFKGPITAIVTPFKNGQVDYDKLEELIEWQIAEGIMGIVPCGTTGESPTLNHQEHKDVIKFTVQAVKKRVPVIAGTGSNCTEEAIELTNQAEKDGADASLQVAPYYNKPTQEGLYRHFKAIADESRIPMVLYNIPGRCGVNILPATVARLAKDCPNIVAIKEAAGSVDQVAEIRLATDPKFAILSGDDALFLPFATAGAAGVISVISNLIPRDMRSFYDAVERNDLAAARNWHLKMFNLIKVLFVETNPIPVKTALFLMGKIGGEMRLPLCEMADANLKKLKDELGKYGLLKS